ncbi:hypothetical protein BKA81DRAFT_81157 [Phyllosticta paracitricarpa]
MQEEEEEAGKRGSMRRRRWTACDGVACGRGKKDSARHGLSRKVGRSVSGAAQSAEGHCRSNDEATGQRARGRRQGRREEREREREKERERERRKEMERRDVERGFGMAVVVRLIPSLWGKSVPLWRGGGRGPGQGPPGMCARGRSGEECGLSGGVAAEQWMTL